MTIHEFARIPRIARKFLGWFLVVALLPLVPLVAINYQNFKATIERGVMERLSITADARANDVANYFEEQESSVLMLAHAPLVSAMLKKLDVALDRDGIDSPVYREARRSVASFFEFISDYGYSNVVLVCAKGDIVFSSRAASELGTNVKTGPYANTELARAVEMATTMLGPTVSDLGPYPASQVPAAFIAAPILEGGKVTGAVAMQVNNDIFFKLTRNHTGLGETGEIVLASKVGNRVTIMNPLRHDPLAAFTRTITLGSPLGIAAQQASQGQQGMGVAVDYRGKRVLAVRRYIPYLNMGMVVKIDEDEAFRSMRGLRNTLVIMVVFIVGLVMAAAWLVARSIARPILFLKEGAEKIGEGDFTHRVGTAARDEIGQLSRAFDGMTERLQQTTTSIENLNEEIARRTKAEKTLREMDARKSDFVANVAHEFKNPLFNIRESTRIVLDNPEGALAPQLHRMIEITNRSADRLLRLVTNLLDIAKIEAGKVQLDATDVDMAPLIDEVAAFFEGEFAAKKLIFRKDVPADLGAVWGDRDKLTEVFINLVGNAAKYTPEGGQITLKVRGTATEVRVEIVDTGEGIAKEYLEKIFDKFERVTAESQEGTGLGLPIAKGIVELHHGKIWMESEVGEGSTAIFILPRDFRVSA